MTNKENKILIGDITNIDQLKTMIKSARFNADNLERMIKEKQYKQAEILSEELSLQLHELDIFKIEVQFKNVTE